MNRLDFIFGFIAGILITSISAGVVIQLTQSNTSNNSVNDLNDNLLEKYDADINITYLNNLAKEIISGGVPPDGIPPIDNPKYWSVDDANTFLSDEEIVFGIIFENGDIYAYPQRILVWHEIVNDNIGGKKISITYCPLTGSVIAFQGKIGSVHTTFGTSGKLLNSNLVMYDRDSGAYWPQILGKAVTVNSPLGSSYNDNFGQKLNKFQTYWVNWGNWKTQYPETQVLSTDTGLLRDYDRDPYGSYSKSDSYYQTGDAFFPLMNKNSDLPQKEVVYGIDLTFEDQIAVSKELLKNQKVINSDIGDSKIVLFYDEPLDSAQVFSRVINQEILEFSYENGIFVDNHGEQWNLKGKNTNDGSKFLNEIVYFDVMWFAWYAFFPNTILLS